MLTDHLVIWCFDTVGWAMWPVKIVPEITYYEWGGTFNPTHPISAIPPLKPNQRLYGPLIPGFNERKKRDLTGSDVTSRGTVSSRDRCDPDFSLGLGFQG